MVNIYRCFEKLVVLSVLWSCLLGCYFCLVIKGNRLVERSVVHLQSQTVMPEDLANSISRNDRNSTRLTSEASCKTICLSWNSCIRLSPRRNPVELASVGRGKLSTWYCSMLVTSNGLDLSQLDFILLVGLQHYINCVRRCVFQRVYVEFTIRDQLAWIGRFVDLFHDGWKSHEWVELLHLKYLYHSFVKTRCLITAQVLIRFQAHAFGIRRGEFALGRFSSECLGFPASLSSVAYPGILFVGMGVQQIQLRTEGRENGDLGAVAPLSGVLEAAVIWYKKFHSI